jgi:uncharacterized protein (TIGR02246 family)
MRPFLGGRTDRDNALVNHQADPTKPPGRAGRGPRQNLEEEEMSSNHQGEEPATSSTASILVEDDSAVHAVFDAVSSAWAGSDADAFIEWYTEDATAILPGYYLPGKANIRASMADAFVGPLNGSRRIHVLQSVRFLDDTAIVISKSSTLFPGEAEPPAERWALATRVLSKHAGRWLIEAYHDCPTG